MKETFKSSIRPIFIIGAILVSLKLSSIIEWSWWWITLPFWWWLIVSFIMAIVSLIKDFRTGKFN